MEYMLVEELPDHRDDGTEEEGHQDDSDVWLASEEDSDEDY